MRARRTDPASSQRFLDDLDHSSLYEDVIEAAAWAYEQGRPFTDDFLAERLHVPRNVVARTRLDVERDGWITRLGLRERKGRQVLAFEMNEAHHQTWVSIQVLRREFHGGTICRDG